MTDSRAAGNEGLLSTEQALHNTILTYCFQQLSALWPRASTLMRMAGFIEVTDDMDKEIHDHERTEAVKNGKAFR